MADAARISRRLEALWGVARGPGGGADRPAYSPAEARGMRLVAGWAQQDGLDPGIDRFGNLWALPPDQDEPLVTSGSHVDTVPDGGRYDGALGTVLGLELALERPRAGVLVCAAEEAPRFGAGTLGSRLLSGALEESSLTEMTDSSGITAAQAREEYLSCLADLPRVEPPLERVRAHAEVHVAQRFALRELGVVTRVASPRRLEIVFRGISGHSGEVSMEDRHDALAAAAEAVLTVEAAARNEPPETVATVGVLDVEPGAVSVIPGRVRLLVDIRAVDPESLDRLQQVISVASGEIARRRSLRVDARLLRGGHPVALDERLAALALAAAAHLGVPVTETWSGAGHDAQHLAALMPTLLMFVPLHGGESHTPQEGAELEEILAAAAVVRAALDGI